MKYMVFTELSFERMKQWGLHAKSNLLKIQSALIRQVHRVYRAKIVHVWPNVMQMNVSACQLI